VLAPSWRCDFELRNADGSADAPYLSADASGWRIVHLHGLDVPVASPTPAPNESPNGTVDGETRRARRGTLEPAPHSPALGGHTRARHMILESILGASTHRATTLSPRQVTELASMAPRFPPRRRPGCVAYRVACDHVWQNEGRNRRRLGWLTVVRSTRRTGGRRRVTLNARSCRRSTTTSTWTASLRRRTSSSCGPPAQIGERQT